MTHLEDRLLEDRLRNMIELDVFLGILPGQRWPTPNYVRDDEGGETIGTLSVDYEKGIMSYTPVNGEEKVLYEF